MRTLLFFIGLTIALGSCKSVQKMVDKGDYDGAIAFAAKKLQGKENKKTKYVKGLEDAFRKITARDMDNYLALASEGREQNWDKMYNILTRIDSRQGVIAPLIPLVSNQGYLAHFDFVETTSLIAEAKEGASKYHYEVGQELIVAARLGDKAAARQAHHEFNTIQRYYADYEDSRELTNEALYLGTNRILVRFADRSFGFNTTRFYDELAFSPAELNTRWTQFHFSPPVDMPIDYEARLSLERADVSRENQDERYFTDTKSIQDGFDYILDSKGNVKKDTLGNDIKEPKFINVEARIIELYRHKEALVEVSIEVIDLHNDVLVDRDRISHNVLFEDYSCTIRGDRRALSNEARNKYKDRPLRFPSDSDMLFTAANEIRDDLRTKLRRSFI